MACILVRLWLANQATDLQEQPQHKNFTCTSKVERITLCCLRAFNKRWFKANVMLDTSMILVWAITRHRQHFCRCFWSWRWKEGSIFCLLTMQRILSEIVQNIMCRVYGMLGAPRWPFPCKRPSMMGERPREAESRRESLAGQMQHPTLRIRKSIMTRRPKCFSPLSAQIDFAFCMRAQNR
jgi:hypothetical protein